MTDQFKPVASVAYSDTYRQAAHPTPGSGNALHQPAPVSSWSMDDEPDASDVDDASDFDESDDAV